VWDWTQFVRVSVKLRPADGFTTPYDQARARTVISRCYYAAYQLADAVISAKNYPIENVLDHGVTWKALRKSGTPDEISAADAGVRLMRDRKKADYHNEIDGNLEEMAKAALSRAKKICKWLGYPVPPIMGSTDD
jgi:hypothetical protein